jgi:hypothetical protein
VRTLTHSTDRPVARVGSWYDEETGRALAQEAIDHSSSELRIAFVSTPAAYRDFLKILSEEQDEAKRAVMGDNVYIFEFDRRFGEKYGDRFCFYDYNAPTSLPDKFHHFFDYVLMEPPHLVRCSATMAEREFGQLTAVCCLSPSIEPRLPGKVLRHDAVAGQERGSGARQEGPRCEPVHVHQLYELRCTCSVRLLVSFELTNTH